MIKENRKLSIADLSGEGNDVALEVNWNRNKMIEECKYIRFQIGEEEAIISRDHLWMVLFMISKKKQQEDMNPTTFSPIKSYPTIINVIAKRDISRNEPYTLPITVSINQRTGQMSIKP